MGNGRRKSSHKGRNIGKNNPDAKVVDPDASKTHQECPSVLVLPRAQNHPSTNKSEKVYWKKPEHWISFITLIFVGIYTVVTTCMLITSKDVESKQLRAWAGIKTVLPPDPIKIGSTLKATVVLTNAGQTPALNFKNLVSIKVLKAGIQILDPKYRIDSTTQNSLSTFLPGNVMYATTLPVESINSNQGAGLLSKEDLDDIVSGRFIVYVFGRITYDDIFSFHHFTNFCMYLKRDLINFTSCDTYNEMDPS